MCDLKCDACVRQNEDEYQPTCGARIVEIVLDGQPYYFNPSCEHERKHGKCGPGATRFLSKDKYKS